ncbi:helicase HerA-like domain-containing protein [Serinibacter salmoneus]|uniref:Helicase HerA-like C-terminal domain-containing protein n=1 Tax=Serinibacter salmoneus TaxID=556530 RepID=A0A2A9D010_9MICO|nr:helicase HerA-like domain-containing protein [Serinibacter salmoneus]PFG20038.1 hypothetical protein ATL40_1621 [Serinibacter salmoneus]
MSTPDEAELARLRAQAAAAEAEAAQARAAAAQAALAAAEAAAAAAEAAAAAAAAAETPPPAQQAPTGTPTEPPTHGDGFTHGETAPSDTSDAQPSGLTGYPAEVAAAYSFPGGALPLGALLVDGEPLPPAQVAFSLGMLNRHGLVAGATGTGKTRTLQAMAEGLSLAGVPVFLADIKGDLSGLITPGAASEKLTARASSIGQDWAPTTFPVEFYSLGGIGPGVPIRTTVTDFGPLLLSKVLGLNQTQESSLGLIFHWADTQGLALLDLKDLQATIAFLTSDEGKAELKGIGGISTATAGVILREIVALQAQGADAFFGEPAFSVSELLRTREDLGVISALELPAVADRPALFSTFLMWLLAELFAELPEVGDLAKPRLVFFFDEAHLLFDDASKDFLDQVVQTVRLIRSKGVGVFFVTQSPQDVPADVLGQLGNRVQHALRAFTPKDATALRAAVRTYPHSPYDLEELLTSLGTGEAVVTVMSESGAPTPVAWTRVRAPLSLMAPAEDSAMQGVIDASPLQARYGTAVDNESAHELLARRAELQAQEAARAAELQRLEKEADERAEAAAKEARAREKELEEMRRRLEREALTASRSSRSASSRSSSSGSRSRRSTSASGSVLDGFLRSAGQQLGREITRTLFGTRRR